MFKSKQPIDVKKTLVKFLDTKRDYSNRLRHLKILFESKDLRDAKEFFNSHHSNVFIVFFENFVHLDAAKYRGKVMNDDIELLLVVFEKILILLPELLEKRWQINSILFIFRKLLHSSNPVWIRKEGLRLFLMYYQILGENNVKAYPQIEILFGSLIPGIVPNLTQMFQSMNLHLSENKSETSTRSPNYGVHAYPNEPFILMMDPNSPMAPFALSSVLGNVPSGNHHSDYKNDLILYFTQLLLDYSITECGKIYWRDYRDRRHLRGFEFIFSSFARIYLPFIFPKMSTPNMDGGWRLVTVGTIISIYDPPNDLPVLRKFNEQLTKSGNSASLIIQVQANIIQWFTRYLLGKDRQSHDGFNGSSTLTPQSSSAMMSSELSNLSKYNSHSMSHHNLSDNSSASTNSSTTNLISASMSSASIVYPILSSNSNYMAFVHDPNTFDSETVRSLLNSKRFYVDLLLSLFHQAFLLPFTEDLQITTRNVLKVYKQWIYKDTDNPLPLFLAEPSSNSSSVSSLSNVAMAKVKSNDDNVCAGFMNLLSIFITSSANVFLLQVPLDKPSILEIQVDVCKRVFNIYRYMVMKIEMEKNVWENLVEILIQITSSIVSKDVPKRREDTLGGRLAPALFQTLIVTWIKANLNVQISGQLWDKFHELVSSLTNWEELISEWSNTMFILNRVMSRFVFNINLNDLPLEKALLDRKRKIRGGPLEPKLHHIRNAPSNSATVNNGTGGMSTVSNTGQMNVSNVNSGASNQHFLSRTNSGNQDPNQRIHDQSKHSFQRFISNESNYSDVSMSSLYRHRISHGARTCINVNFLAISVSKHRKYHSNSNHRHPQLVRSLSDSCLHLSVQHSLCGIRNSVRHHRKRSYKHIKRQQVPNSINKPQQLKNMPMIDDEVDEEECCTLVDSDLNYAHEMDGDYSDECSSVATEEFYDENLLAYFLKQKSLYRCKSLDEWYLATNRHWSLWAESNAETMSIGTSTGHHECNSLKDTPLGFDSTSAASTNSSVAEQMGIGAFTNNSIGNKHTYSSNEANTLASSRPVLLGGTHRGWNAEISVMLWRRMLGILGDINDIEDPTMHKLAFECLAKITEDFIKIKDNITFLNNQNDTSVPLASDGRVLQPSLYYYSAWLFRATQLSNEYKAGKLLAYKLLCIIALHRGEQETNREFLILFYLAIKRALANSCSNMELTCIIIKFCGLKFFFSPLVGSSCLLYDFVSASSLIVSSPDTKYPRVEALNLLGSLIGFFDIYSNVLILRDTTTPALEPYKDLKENVLEILILASKREPTGSGRSISFCSLGIFLYKEFQKGSDYYRLKEIVKILIAGTRVSVKRPKTTTSPCPPSPSPPMSASQFNNTNTSASSNAKLDNNSKFNNRVLCRVACDMLRLQSDHATYLVDKHPDIASQIIEGLCSTLQLHIDVVQRETTNREFKNLLLSIMFCLSHWCMSVSKQFLINTTVSNLNNVNASFDRYEDHTNEAASKTPPPMSLLDMVIFLFNSIANLDANEIVQRRLDRSTLDALNSSSSYSDMDTIDYSIIDSMSSGAVNGSVRMEDSGSSVVNRLQDVNTIKKAAHLILLHFLNFMSHFPLPKLRASSLCALINENDDNINVSSQLQHYDKVDYESLNASNVLVFMVNDTCLMSFVELPPDSVESSILSKMSTSNNLQMNLQKARPIRVIIRNLLGKFVWDCVMLRSPILADCYRPIASKRFTLATTLENVEDDSENEAASKQQSLVKDNLGLLVNEILNISPECQSNHNNDFLQSLNQIPEAVDTVALFMNQHFQENRFAEEQQTTQCSRRMSAIGSNVGSSEKQTNDRSVKRNDSVSSNTSLANDPAMAFQYCRQMVEQLGFLSWEKRATIDLISKSQSTIRELRHLDSQRCREKHKIAVIYVAHGQETKEALLSNKSGSRAFEEFVARLGWEVNLATHVGFMGGLESNLSTGLTAPYFADSFNEVIFHVSTRLEPAANSGADSTVSQVNTQAIEKQQLMNKKMRHLGNDEVHIVWSEHYKDYRRSILATEFCDALIVIYPLSSQTYPNLFRIQVWRKPEVPFFGPLFNGAVVHRDELAGLVRTTAINASRAKRIYMPSYKAYFEERYDSIKKLATDHKERATFEEYATRVYAPRYDLLPVRTEYDQWDYCECSTQYPVTTGVVSIENFVHHYTNGTGLVSSPSNADSISLASTGATSTSFNEIALSSVINTGAAVLNATNAQLSTSTSSCSVRGSRPTSRSSFTQK